MKKICALLFLCTLLAGCASANELLRQFQGVSTKDIDDARKNAEIKIFEYDLKTCYEKTGSILQNMPKVKVISKEGQRIEIYYVDPNTTPVGIYFTAVDATHTKVEISSPGKDAKDWVAKNVFGEKVLTPTKDVTPHKKTGEGRSRKR